jgi:hypothetical protein
MSSRPSITAVLKVDGDAVNLAISVAAKSMLCGFLNWENQMPVPDKNVAVGDFAKRVSLWHELVLMPMSIRARVSLCQNPPVYLKQVLQQRNLTEMEGSNNRMFELHARLLVAASQSLVTCLEEREIGMDTKEQIQHWFDLLLRLKSVENAQRDTQRSFKQVGVDHKGAASRNRGRGAEYALFDHRVLFIHIAHIVHFTCVETKSRLLSVSKCQMRVSKSMIERWEQDSGRFFNTRLSFPDNGSLLDQQGPGAPAFRWIELPRSWFQTQMRAWRTSLPSILEMHMILLNTTCGKIEEMQTGRCIGPHERQETDKFHDTVGATCAALNKCKITLGKREKARRNHRSTGFKKKPRSYQYKADDPHTFERDIFLLGKESYYYLFNTENGQGFRRMKAMRGWTTEEVLPVQEEDPNAPYAHVLVDNMMMNDPGDGYI